MRGGIGKVSYSMSEVEFWYPSCFKSDVGRRRKENQDSYGYVVTARARLYIVADGMGGARGGATASQIAVRTICAHAIESDGTISEHSLRRAFQIANNTIFEKSRNEETLSGMGTTAVVLVFQKGSAFVAHVGDSRAYRLHQGKLFPITKDHSLVQELLDSGAITDENVEHHPIGHMLTRSLGPSASVEVEIHSITDRVEIGDRFLLCCDGVVNMLDDKEIEAIMSSGSATEAATTLIERANEKGGTDNSTVQIIDVQHIDTSTESPISQDVAKVFFSAPSSKSFGGGEETSDADQGFTFTLGDKTYPFIDSISVNSAPKKPQGNLSKEDKEISEIDFTFDEPTDSELSLGTKIAVFVAAIAGIVAISSVAMSLLGSQGDGSAKTSEFLAKVQQTRPQETEAELEIEQQKDELLNELLANDGTNADASAPAPVGAVFEPEKQNLGADKESKKIEEHIEVKDSKNSDLAPAPIVIGTEEKKLPEEELRKVEEIDAAVASVFSTEVPPPPRVPVNVDEVAMLQKVDWNKEEEEAKNLVYVSDRQADDEGMVLVTAKDREACKKKFDLREAIAETDAKIVLLNIHEAEEARDLSSAWKSSAEVYELALKRIQSKLEDATGRYEEWKLRKEQLKKVKPSELVPAVEIWSERVRSLKAKKLALSAEHAQLEKEAKDKKAEEITKLSAVARQLKIVSSELDIAVIATIDSSIISTEKEKADLAVLKYRLEKRKDRLYRQSGFLVAYRPVKDEKKSKQYDELLSKRGKIHKELEAYKKAVNDRQEVAICRQTF